MRWLLLLALLSTSALASRADRLSVSPRLDRRDRLGASSGPETVFFALTDPGNECSGAPIQGLTFSRSGAQPCANATMTTTMVGTGLPAIEPDGLAFPPQANSTFVSVQNPFADGADRVYGVVYVPVGDAINSGTGMLFVLGEGAYGSNDSSAVFVAGDRVTLREVSGAGLSSQWNSAIGSLTPGPHHIRVRVPPVAAPELWIDGVSTPFTLGTGLATTRVTTSTGTLRVGATATGQFRLKGRVRDLCASRDLVGCPSSVPSERAGAKVIALGDSITSGGSIWPVSAVEHPKRLQYLYGYSSNFSTNAGSSGYTTSQVLGRWQTQGLGKGFGVVVLLAGVNDMLQGISAATAWANLKQIIDEAKAGGATVVVSTVFPTVDVSGTPAKQAELEALNTLIRNYAASESLVLVDGYALMGDPLNPQVLNPLYNSGDGLHPNEAGNIAFAQAVYDALNPPAPLAGAGGGETLGWLGALAALGAAGAGVYAARRRSA